MDRKTRKYKRREKISINKRSKKGTRGKVKTKNRVLEKALKKLPVANRSIHWKAPLKRDTPEEKLKKRKDIPNRTEGAGGKKTKQSMIVGITDHSNKKKCYIEDENCRENHGTNIPRVNNENPRKKESIISRKPAVCSVAERKKKFREEPQKGGYGSFVKTGGNPPEVTKRRRIHYPNLISPVESCY